MPSAAMESNMAGDTLISAGMLADQLRQLVLASCDLGESGTSCLNGTPMVPLHRATLGSIYQHLERLAKYDGETTNGQHEWTAWDQAIPDGLWHTHKRLDGRWQAIRCTQDGERKVVEFDHEIVFGGEHPREVVPIFNTGRSCAERCAELNGDGNDA